MNVTFELIKPMPEIPGASWMDVKETAGPFDIASAEHVIAKARQWFGVRMRVTDADAVRVLDDFGRAIDRWSRAECIGVREPSAAMARQDAPQPRPGRPAHRIGARGLERLP